MQQRAIQTSAALLTCQGCLFFYMRMHFISDICIHAGIHVQIQAHTRTNEYTERKGHEINYNEYLHEDNP